MHFVTLVVDKFNIGFKLVLVMTAAGSTGYLLLLTVDKALVEVEIMVVLAEHGETEVPTSIAAVDVVALSFAFLCATDDDDLF